MHIATTRIKKLIAFAIMIMASPICIPYNVHRKTPALNWHKVTRLTSFEDLVLCILIIWGTKPNVVSNAAIIPIEYQYISGSKTASFSASLLPDQ